MTSAKMNLAQIANDVLTQPSWSQSLQGSEKAIPTCHIYLHQKERREALRVMY